MTFSASEHTALQGAYDALNDGLFDGELEPLALLLHRKRGALGYFRPEAFKVRGDGGAVHELALNPDTFEGRTDLEILSTLAHEQAHQWQQDHGKPPRRCYHDKQWAQKMEQIGLMPSNTGQEGGKKTGPKMTHYIIPGGAFEQVAQEIIDGGFKIGLDGCPPPPAQKKEGSKDKVKYSCEPCKVNAWAKPDCKLLCGTCGLPLEPAEL